jgi:hypothetical protein
VPCNPARTWSSRSSPSKSCPSSSGRSARSAIQNDRFSDGERAFLEAIAHIHDTPLNADALVPATPADVARTVPDPHRRKRAVQLAIVLALVEGEPTTQTEAAVRRLAAALGIEEPGMRVLYELAQRHTLLARFEMARRMREGVRNIHGFPGFLRTALPFLGIGGTHQETSARYRALAACPEGSFGRALHQHFRENGFAFPGEKHGIPESMVFHDVGHVLSGYGVDPEGEIQQAAFQAGFRRTDGFLFLLFGVLQFHLGVRLTPAARAQRGYFDVKRVLRAAERGAACKVDLGSGFDPFAYADMSLDTMRRRLGIPVN